MKTVRVVAGIIIEDGNFQVERLSKVRHRKKQL